MTRPDDRWTPMTIEYQGHIVRRGWQTRGRSFAFGNAWTCRGADGQQSQYCPFCCDRNGWTWIDPNTMQPGTAEARAAVA